MTVSGYADSEDRAMYRISGVPIGKVKPTRTLIVHDD